MLKTHPYAFVKPPPGAWWDIVGIVLENGRRPAEDYLNRAGVDASGLLAFANILLKSEPFKQVGKRFKRLKHVSNVFQITVDKDRYLGFRWRQ